LKSYNPLSINFIFMKTRFDKVNGIELHSSEEGEAGSEVIIFLHGFPEYGGAWQKQLNFMAHNGYHAIAPDQRGYNLSSKFKEVKAYLIKYLIADIVALINRITSNRIILAGHDWGGAVAWELAMRHPGLLKKLVILNMPHPAVMIHTLKTNPQQMLKSWYLALFQIPVIPELICKSFDFKFLKQGLLKTAHKNTFSEGQMINYKQTWRQPGALQSMINWYRASRYYSVKDVTITVPTLIIWGKNDQFLKASMAQSSIERCVDGKIFILDNATHWLHHEMPDQINRLILDFIQT
jgi:epoxide hydrolase 4